MVTLRLAPLVSNPDEERWYQANYRNLQSLLRRKKLPKLQESAHPSSFHYHRMAFSCSDLQQLRLTAARFKYDPNYQARPEVPENGDSDIDAASALFNFHLLVHSDFQGFYLPIDFDDVLFDRKKVPGKFAGSSLRLAAELEHMAAALGLQPGSPELESQIAGPPIELGPQRHCWAALYHWARASVAEGRVLAFC